MSRAEPEIRRATDEDLSAIIGIATAALGWDPADPNEDFFRWKHLDNPAGRSPMWVACDGGEVIGFRAMLRWEFTGPSGGHIRAVRAVDTATHPDHHRRGIFRALTMAAVEELSADGVDFVFNTPNENSRPGYLKMGWIDAGRLRVSVSIARPTAAMRLLRARTAAEKWSEPIEAGEELATMDTAELETVLALARESDASIQTTASVQHLAWRYSFPRLNYRLLRTPDAAAIVRVRRRGAATECVLAELFAPDTPAARAMIRSVAEHLEFDHLLAVTHAPHPRLRLPSTTRLGPRLTLRSLAAPLPDPERLRFSLGDIELF